MDEGLLPNESELAVGDQSLQEEANDYGASQYVNSLLWQGQEQVFENVPFALWSPSTPLY